nr:MAG TPA: hypothetical protein [Bacteriophage sp.]
MNIYICDVPFDRDTFINVSLDKVYEYYSKIEDADARSKRYNDISNEIDCINQEICVLKEKVFELEKEKYRLFGDNSSFLVDNFCNNL